MNLRDHVARRTVELVAALAEGRAEPWMIARARELLPALSPRPAPKKRPIASIEISTANRRTEDLEESEAKRLMRYQVFAWNFAHTSVAGVAPFGACDCGCGAAFASRTEGECDHWIERSQGGEHTRENGWRLLPRCHRQKTDNAPDRATWNARREAYCARAGVPFVPRRER